MTVCRCVISLLLLTLFCSCDKKFKKDDFVAYFGGEVSNPTSPYVLFCKEGVVIDTIPLGKDNRFFKKFDSLTPGMYSFRNEPEYQYLYFDKNDSLMVRVNAADFDESLVFCGRGSEKNNFLMELYLKYEHDKKNIYTTYEARFDAFNKIIDSAYQAKTAYYNNKKEKIKWSPEFEQYAKAMLDFNYYAKKEIYPIVHKIRTGSDIRRDIPKQYYDFRKNIDLDNQALASFSPFVKYLTYMLDNIAIDDMHSKGSDAELALDINIRKMNIADTLFENEKIRNTILDNIAFSYLLEDQNIVNNQKFFETYHAVSSDKSKHNEIVRMGKALQMLTPGNLLPTVMLKDKDGRMVRSSELLEKPAVIFFWTENLESHLVAAHSKILELKKRHPSYTFISVNVDKDHASWARQLNSYNFGDIRQFQAADFEDMRRKWAIYKIHRTMVTTAGGKIDNAFVSLFESGFEKHLK